MAESHSPFRQGVMFTSRSFRHIGTNEITVGRFDLRSPSTCFSVSQLGTHVGSCIIPLGRCVSELAGGSSIRDKSSLSSKLDATAWADSSSSGVAFACLLGRYLQSVYNQSII